MNVSVLMQELRKTLYTIGSDHMSNDDIAHTSGRVLLWCLLSRSVTLRALPQLLSACVRRNVLGNVTGHSRWNRSGRPGNCQTSYRNQIFHCLLDTLIVLAN